jgi:mannitol/fructose-specific phosphotransferase system IIA component (Ntr-type)/DNA-directed RNA polymerase subunit RPC12/RpoP
MKSALDELIRLQELYFALSEQRSLTPSAGSDEIEKDIRSLVTGLSKELASLCERLRRRDVTIMAPVVDGVCSACGVTLPTAQIYEIQIAERIYQCPSCSRILYSRPGAPRQLRRVGSFGQPRSGVGRFSDKSLMCPDLEAETKEGVLSELIQRMARQGVVENPDALLEAALERETIMTTAVNHGLAFPHVRGVEGGGLTFSMGLKKEGIAFDSPDGGLTSIIFFIVIPSAASAFYLQLLSGLIEAFQGEEPRKTLLNATTPNDAWEALTLLSCKAIR